MRRGGGGKAYMRGAYTWSHTSVKDKVGLSGGGGLYVKKSGRLNIVMSISAFKQSGKAGTIWFQ